MRYLSSLVSFLFSNHTALRHIANLLECMAMFYFDKGLTVFRIAAKPYANGLLLLGCFVIFLHNALDVGGLRLGKERLVLPRA